MKITNKHALPEAVYNLIAKDNYDAGKSDYSVTTLLSPPRLVHLQRRHWEELEEDAIDRVWSLFGHTAHSLLEQHGAEGALSEERLYVDILGRKIGGQVDNYHDGVITDYKVTSSWTLVYGSRLHEWEAQLNMYAHIFRENGHKVDKLQIVAILRDWDKNKAKADWKYPQVPIVIIPLKMWEDKDVATFMDRRVDAMIWNEGYEDDKLDLCSSEDMWEQPTKWALMKKDRKTAVRVVETEEECDELSKQYKIDGREYYWQQRPGKRTRCESYCSCSKFCNQWKEYCGETS